MRCRAIALSELPLLGRNRELSRLEAAVTSGSPALVQGPPGIGKTRLLLELQRRLSSFSTDAVYIRFSQPLHAFLVDLAHRLSVNVGSGSSIAFRRAIWKALESNPRVMLLDDVSNAGPLFYRFLERIRGRKGM